MTAAIKAIETEYAGCRFRSRLEARWAVFFDHLGLAWNYEPEGLEFDGVRYLPDFQLPDLENLYVEVKGKVDIKGTKKIVGLAANGRAVLVVTEIPRPGALGPYFRLFMRGPTTGPEGQRCAVSKDVSILPRSIDPVTWTLMPFGWASLPFWPHLEETLHDCTEHINNATDMQGWVMGNYVLDDAFSAARSARFDGTD